MKWDRLTRPRGGGLLEPVWPAQSLLGCGQIQDGERNQAKAINSTCKGPEAAPGVLEGQVGQETHVSGGKHMKGREGGERRCEETGHTM